MICVFAECDGRASFLTSLDRPTLFPLFLSTYYIPDIH